MPVKQWLEERRFMQVGCLSCLISYIAYFLLSMQSKIYDLKYLTAKILQGEMQQLRDKLAIAERTARSEAQLKVNCCNVHFELNF